MFRGEISDDELVNRLVGLMIALGLKPIRIDKFDAVKELREGWD